MKTWLIAALMVVAGAMAVAPSVSEAKRLGGGKSVGTQRTATPDAAPAKPAATNQAAPAAAAPAAAAAGKRSWMGPLAGLAAGLGIMALMSHLGLGEAFGNFLMMAILALVGVLVVGFLIRKFGRGAASKAGSRPQGMQYAGAGAASGGAGSPSGAGNVLWPSRDAQAEAAPLARNATESTSGITIGSAIGSGSAPVGAVQANALPADFDAPGFERIAKMIFIRLQAANDAADLNDLRAFTTPEMYAHIKLDLEERGVAAQHTEVIKVDAQVLDLAEELDRQVVSVRFSGTVREEDNGPEVTFDEVWHLVKPADDSRSWAISGIQQRH